ncbi:MAG TPA: nuclear transport factor 2 family protein [Pseudoxanthomonas sp.]|nr:nuclear transport factor 2 family protein [Pseudoxanthomonas sp.]
MPFLPLIALAVATITPVQRDQAEVAALDTAFQAAVKANDADAMAKVLADDYVLVLGDGRTQNKADLLAEAREKHRDYERQEELEQHVRAWGDTAVVTAKLWLKGTHRDGSAFDYQLWFSDTYVRTPQGWKYVLGQASLPLPKP